MHFCIGYVFASDDKKHELSDMDGSSLGVELSVIFFLLFIAFITFQFVSPTNNPG